MSLAAVSKPGSDCKSSDDPHLVHKYLIDMISRRRHTSQQLQYLSTPKRKFSNPITCVRWPSMSVTIVITE